jgi:hypothetical protein
MAGSIMDLFRPGVPVAGAQPAQQAVPSKDVSISHPNNAQVPSGVSATAAADASTRGDAVAAGGTPADTSPLAEYAKLWDTDNTNKADPNSAPIFNIDRTVLAQNAAKVDFSGGINPELVTKALGGDTKAFLEVINTVGQKALAEATFINSHITDRALSISGERSKASQAAEFRKMQVQENLSQNPIFSNPAVAPILQMATAQIQAKNPGATAAEVQKQAEKYVMEFASLVTDVSSAGANASAAEAAKKADRSFDFSTFDMQP